MEEAKKEKEEKGKAPAEADVVDGDSDKEHILSMTYDRRSRNEWIMDTGCTFHICPHRDWFMSLEDTEGDIVYIGNEAQCPIAGIGSVQIKTHDGSIRTLTNVRYVPDLKRNLISLGTLESLGYKYFAKGAVLKVSTGVRTILKATELVPCMFCKVPQ